MKEEIVYCDGEKIVEVRSDGGKLLYKKTSRGYEMKCPRTKKICVVPYEQMLVDCLRCLDGETLDHLRKEYQ
jgi:hypothetical protein